MYKLINPVKYYYWGTETWIGAYPNGSSCISILNSRFLLYDLIESNKLKLLGSKIFYQFNALPFLIKILNISHPISVQVHPTKLMAKIGFYKENNANVNIYSPQRNYRDNNHKPEVILALTPFKVMSGFRKLTDIIYLLKSISNANPSIISFLKNPSKQSLKKLFISLINMTGITKIKALDILKLSIEKNIGEPWETIRYISIKYPNDNCLFLPFLLNIFTLLPEEIIYLPVGTLHTYLDGIALEIAANSDNVLRAGLTKKHIDIPELINNTNFNSQSIQDFYIKYQKIGNTKIFPVLVDDFSFSIDYFEKNIVSLNQNSAIVLICISGYIVVSDMHKRITLYPNESCFISANKLINITGEGILVRVYI